MVFLGFYGTWVFCKTRLSVDTRTSSIKCEMQFLSRSTFCFSSLKSKYFEHNLASLNKSLDLSTQISNLLLLRNTFFQCFPLVFLVESLRHIYYEQSSLSFAKDYVRSWSWSLPPSNTRRVFLGQKRETFCCASEVVICEQMNPLLINWFTLLGIIILQITQWSLTTSSASQFCI